MNFKLTVNLTHPQWGAPVVRNVSLQGSSREQVIQALECPEYLKHNLLHHGRTGFKDARGVKHHWTIEQIEDAAG